MSAKDLSKQAPTSPRVRTGGYAVLSRALDKCRSEIAGTTGEYHYACPLDMMLFDFKGVAAADVKKLIETGSSDEDIAIWMDGTGHPKSEAEKAEWSDGLEAARPYDNPEKKDWFIGVCAEAKCDPATSTLFDFLEADDKTTFAA
jgi:Domain of unknown function (DUF5069)